ncbi:MAG: hypothetical protein AAF281_02225 [Pseudomonadota bacterium]
MGLSIAAAITLTGITGAMLIGYVVTSASLLNKVDQQIKENMKKA